ncbi:MAG: GNAT family N-acetyltransferase [Symbiobacteriaceae bacterium]|nr:MAG: GNAT family N-acetyltransferase [Bacillota bacterium]
MTVVIRNARPGDAPAIARVQVATWRSTYRGIIPDEYLDTMEEEPRAAWWRDVIARDSGASDQAFIVVADDGERGVVGFAAGGPERTGDPQFRGELGAIYILEAYQRRGIGRRLVREVARRLLERGFDSMLVWVLAENPFRAFYEALGGHRVRSRSIEIGGKTLEEWAYGWDDIRSLAGDSNIPS